ncbi:MAG: hypothetical protein WCO06_01405 [Candidatus Roizmanbacteria bacterium]
MKKYEKEYEDAPSGMVTFYNYKEPLMKFDEGYGFMGALIFDSETDKVQCHLCGTWLGQLPHHLHREHNMSASQYKDKVGLFQTTALISESMRDKLIASGLDKRLQNLKKGHKKTEEEKQKIRETNLKNGQKPEGMNIRGTCPAQLLDRLKKLYEEQGDSFTINYDRRLNVNPQTNISGAKNLAVMLRKTFGSVKEACQLAGVPYRIPGRNRNYNHSIKYTEELALSFIKEYLIRFNKIPTYKDFKLQNSRGLYNSVIKTNKNLKLLASKVYISLDEYRKSDERINYTKESLLDFLRKFEKIHSRKPSISDGKRCLIPYPSRYIYHFGSWKKALELAFN